MELMIISVGCFCAFVMIGGLINMVFDKIAQEKIKKIIKDR